MASPRIGYGRAPVAPGMVQPQRTTIAPEVYQGKQQFLADALMRSRSTAQQGPQDIGAQVGQALNTIGTSYMAGANERAGQAERSAANDTAKAALAAALRGEPLDAGAIDAIGSEWVDPGYQQVIGTLLAQQMKPGDTDLVQAVDPTTGDLVWTPKSQAAGMGSSVPKESWQITDALEGNEKITYRINPTTGEKEEIGRGPAYAPQQGDGGPKTSLVPFYATDPATGEVQMWQPTASGVPVRVQLPPGVTPTKPLSFQDLGTSIVGMNPLGGGQQVVMPKDVAGVESQQVQGAAQGQATVDLPNTLAKAAEAHAQIQKLRTHPGRTLATGGTAILPVVPGTAAKDFDVLLQQAKGGVFLQAYQQLKGGGAITNIEGEKGEQAIARMDRAQSEGEFLSALDDLDAVISAGEARMKARAGQPVATPENTPPPAAAGPNIVQQLPPGFN